MQLNQPRYLGLLAFLVSATLGALHPANGQSQTPTLDRPPVPSIGDTFTYRWNTEIVGFTYLGRDGDLNCYSAKVSSTRQSTVCRTSEDNTVRRAGSWEPRTFNPYHPDLSFPLFVGRQWEFSYNWGSDALVAAAGQYNHEMNNNRIVKARVVSYEKVTVPAGTFDAFKIEGSDGRWGEAVGLPSIVYYYSPQVGFVKYDQVVNKYGGVHYELINYTRAK